ncbi:alkylhydroperoxidase/carboxymuconolactone decarboxylase family protein [Anaerohalosphaera lusitana]|uniref:Alkylhydroperoxidase/carboxymuconolactone decarboxylase family protein n=1 Tax=Anaerohalosphaera lusitana TaxID=1936003 RepID=A0A1U9NQW0_9BACT|nr:carboxymuconolactone decarboxylase family protein [Anaerohalosphaera lusitana]AQT70167.1 alkylhydroperoxidase/carboxymuconolactone decarboxylase family protein [Anaerohalosphaera lusitana]
MANQAKDFYGEWKHKTKKMQEMAPDTVKGFAGMFEKIMGEGALSVREKELVALGIGLSEQCQPCIYLHVQKCLAAGATKEQIMEAASVSVVMSGGPAFTHLPEVIEALEALEA